MNTFVSSIYSASLALCLMSAGLLRDGRVRAQREFTWLSWFLCVESIAFALELLMVNPATPLKGLWLGLRMSDSLFVAPCLFLAVRETVDGIRPRFSELGRGNLLAIGVGVLMTLPLIEDCHWGVTYDHPGRPISWLHARFIHTTMLMCIGIFAVQVPILLWRCRQLLFSRTEGVRSGWLQVPLLVVAVTWVLSLLRTLQCAAHLTRSVVLFSAATEVTVTFGAIFFLLRQVALFRTELQIPKPIFSPIIETPRSVPGELKENQGVELIVTTRKYMRSALTLEMRTRIKRKLDEVLSTDAVRGDSLLSLRLLSRAINEKAHYVSQVMNQDMGTNFHELVSRYRIDRACKLLIESSERSVLEIAFAVGFNSKSTFNTAFRRLTGQTPSEYRVHKHNDVSGENAEPIA